MGSAEDDVENGGNQIPDSGDEEGPLVGPGAPVPVVRHKRPLEFEKAFLDSLPSAQM
jgi:peptidylprolyl isomerase domain and WD repeat-containing protein 1